MHSILISGGASGIGLRCAQRAAERGWQVVILDADQNSPEIASGLPGENHLGISVDVTDAAAVEAAISQLERIDSAVVSAGIVSEKLLTDISPQEFQKIFNVNVFGVQNVLSSFTRKLLSLNATGSSVVLSSLSAFNGGGLMGRGAYAASKAAVVGLVRSYARENQDFGLRYNAVAPGATETPMVATLSDQARARIAGQMPGGKFLDPDQVVQTILFLVSDSSSAINGQVLHANGGVYFG